MVFILFHIVFSSFFVLCVRWTQRRNEDEKTVGAINYLVAAAGSAVVFAYEPQATITANSVFSGVVGGIFYFVAFCFLIVAAGWKGAANTTVVSRLSILVPIFAGALLWNEWPGVGQFAAIALACVALLLIGRKSSQLENAQPPKFAGILLVAFFVCGGCCRLAPEMFKNICHPSEKSGFVMILFGITAIASIGLLRTRKRLPKSSEIAAGIAMGTANLLQIFCMVAALQSYDGFIVFPMTAAGSLVFTTFIAVFLLDERLSRSSLAGVAIATCALFLLHP